MRNVIDIDGHKAVVTLDSKTKTLRGEFLGLNGGADFYADAVPALIEEGRTSLRVFFATCREHGIEPTKEFSGKFNLRLPPKLHQAAAAAAAAAHQSLNEWVAAKIEQAVMEEA